MCNKCVAVEEPVQFWELLATLAEDFCLTVAGAPIESVERSMTRANLWHIVQAYMDAHGGRDAALMVLSGYVERIERRAGLGEFAGRREPIPNMVHTIGSMEN